MILLVSLKSRIHTLRRLGFGEVAKNSKDDEIDEASTFTCNNDKFKICTL